MIEQRTGKEGIVESREWIRMIYEAEREMVRTLTTWIYRVGEPELKYLLCQHVWESAQHGRFLRERGKELGWFGRDETARPGLQRIFEGAVLVADVTEGLACFYGVLKPMVQQACTDYLAAAEPLADWPTRQLVTGFLTDMERQAEEWTAAAGDGERTGLAQRMGDWIAEQGGLRGVLRIPLDAYPEWLPTEIGTYRPPATCNRNGYPVCDTAFGEDAAAYPVVGPWIEDPGTDARVIRIMIYVWLLNEMDAVDYLATIFYDTPQMPHAFHYDAARHLWDESRHSQFGYRQLPRLGYDLGEIEQQVELYNILVRMDPAERYAMMTMQFEAGSFGIKAKVMERVRELNDFEADTLLAFDRNDEQNHVRYGHRWIESLMKEFGHSGTVEEFLGEANTRFAGIRTDVQKDLGHGLEPARRLTAEKIRERILQNG